MLAGINFQNANPKVAVLAVSQIIFGVRSPLVVDFEVTAERIGAPFAYGVSVTGSPRTFLIRDIKNVDDLDGVDRLPAVPCAFAPKRREELADRAQDMGFPLAETLIDPTAILPPKLIAGAGGFINACAVIGAACRFGTGVLINRSASIGHHALLGDWVSIGPGAILSGGIQIGHHSVIGAGAVLQTGIRVGDNVRIAAGSVVRKNVSDNSIVSGNPGKSMPMRAVPSTLAREGDE